MDNRPTVAAICTAYWPPNHSDVFVGPMLRGYELYGEKLQSRVRVASMYIDQFPENDTGRATAAEFGIPIYDTIAEAIGLGKPGVHVDGVLLFGEHGEYGRNELGQDLYPRRRFFEAAISTMISANTFVPIFNDKHFAWNTTDATWIVETARRLGIPLLGGSSLPVTWRYPALELPLGATGLTEAMTVAYGPIERYGYHGLELMQSIVERRAGGETGVAAITTLEGDAVWEAGKQGLWSRKLFDAAIAAVPGNEGVIPEDEIPEPIIFLVEYLDGLKASVFLVDGLMQQFASAIKINGEIQACINYVQMKPPYGHGTFLLRQWEALVLDGVSPIPAERTLLATAMTDFGMRSSHQGNVRIAAPELAIAYTPPAHVPDTGNGAEPPADWREDAKMQREPGNPAWEEARKNMAIKRASQQ
jgi:hypothetical protein